MNRLAAFAIAATLSVASAAYAGPKEDLIAADQAFSALSVAQGSNAAFLAYIADDVRLFGTGSGAPLYGKAAVEQSFKTTGNGDPKTNILSWVPDNAVISADGTLGYTDGHWLFAGGLNAQGKGGVRLTGHYVTVWRNEARGWKVIADIGTTDPQKQ